MTRILLLLGQSPFDPTSGAAQSMRQIAQLLATAGARVRSLSTTGTEGEVAESIEQQLAAHAAQNVRAETTRSARVWRADVRGLAYELVEIDHARRHSWEHVVGSAYAARLDALRLEFCPQVVLTFGGDAPDARRRAQLRADGARVVFALHNLDYLAHAAPAHVDEFLAPTEFLANRYRAAWGAPITVLRPPVDETHVVSATHDPVCVCFVNPEPAKGAALVARLAQRLGRERPDVPLLVFGGRASGGGLEYAANQLGFSLKEFPNLLSSPPTSRVADLWATCRILLAPSVVEEAAGRVALEAMLNGAVPLVSDRGGLPEMVGDAGHVIALPAGLTARTPFAVSDAVIEDLWIKLARLLDDQAHFELMSRAARQQGSHFTFSALTASYGDWLRRIGK